MSKSKIKTAREFMTEIVIAHVNKNYGRLHRFHEDIDDVIISDLKNKAWVLDWILGEVLDEGDFYPNVEKKWWDENTRSFCTIYRFGGKRIQRTHKVADKVSIHDYIFVKPVWISVKKYVQI